MNKKHSFLIMLVLLLSMILAACSESSSSSTDEADESDSIRILSGGTGGIYYPLGVAFATIISDATGIETNAEISGSSVESLNALKDKNAEMAFSQTDITSYAVKGTDMFEGSPIHNVQAIGSLYPETIQIVTTKTTGIKSVEDLKGKKVSVGVPGSGTASNAEQILDIHGLTFEDINKQDLDFDESTQGIKDGTIDAAFVTAGTPTGAVESLAATEDIVIIPIKKAKVDALMNEYPFYIQDEIPSGTYGLDDAVPTVAVQAMLVVRDDLSEDLVYDLTKALFENIDSIQHEKADQIKAEKALDGVRIVVHPGAQKYFEEKEIVTK